MAASPEQLLRALKAGAPIDGADGMRLLSPACADAIRSVSAEVAAIRGRGANRALSAYWITGDPGNGKTQSLRLLVHQLPLIPGAGKYAIAVVDFHQEPAAGKAQGLTLSVVRQTLLSGVSVGGLQEAREEATRGRASDPSTIESVAFGADVLAALSGLPPVSLIAARGYRWALKQIRIQRQYVRRKIGNKFPNHPQLVEFLGAWADYVLAPTRQREIEIGEYLGRLASVGSLLGLFGYALENSGYTTLVLALDEVDMVALRALKTLWDPPINPVQGLSHNLNLVFAISALDKVYNAAMRDPAIQRRLCDTENGRYRLQGPTVHPTPPPLAPLPDDDLTHVVRKVTELTNASPYLKRPDSPQDLAQLRGRLAARRSLTWQNLWHEAIDLLVNL